MFYEIYAGDALQSGQAGFMDPLTLDYLYDSGACVVGDPDRCIEIAMRYEEAGCDLLFCLFSHYKMKHEDVVRSTELMGTHVLPEFSARAWGARIRHERTANGSSLLRIAPVEIEAAFEAGSEMPAQARGTTRLDPRPQIGPVASWRSDCARKRCNLLLAQRFSASSKPSASLQRKSKALRAIAASSETESCACRSSAIASCDGGTLGRPNSSWYSATQSSSRNHLPRAP